MAPCVDDDSITVDKVENCDEVSMGNAFCDERNVRIVVFRCTHTWSRHQYQAAVPFVHRLVPEVHGWCIC